MTAISATMVKDLREKTGAGMMDCKAALNETAGDMEAAVDWLRTKGLAKAAKKAGRVAAEGLIGLAADDTQAALVEVNSETDFVARNDKFQEMVRTIAADALKAKGDLDKLAKGAYGGGKITVADHLKEMIGSIGENMTLRRSAYLGVKNGAVASYMHNTISPGLGKIGVIVALESTGDAAKLKSFGKQVAMHIAAANPQSVDVSGLDPALRRARARGSDRAGEGVRQAHARHREDGRGPLAQILRRGRAAVAGLRPRSGDDRRQGACRDRAKRRRADQDHGLPSLRPWRGDRPARQRFRSGSRRCGVRHLRGGRGIGSWHNRARADRQATAGSSSSCPARP